MSGYRINVDHDGWRWIGTPDQPTGFVALPHTSGHVAHRIVEELNGLLHAHDAQKARAEKALDEAIARADKASNALIRTTAALRETTTRAEKAEARVAELERGVATAKVGYYAPCAWCWSTVFAPNGEQVTCPKCGRRTPVPAPEGTETVQKAPPPSPAGAPRSDQGSNSAGQAGNPGPGRSDPRGSESSNLDTAYPTEEPYGPKTPDRIVWFATPEADAFRVYDEMLRNPGHPQRGLAPEEVKMFGSTDTFTIGKSPDERPVYGSCRGCKGLTPDPEIPFCAMCCDLGRGGASKKDLDQMREVIARRATTCEDVKCPCVEANPRPTRPPPGICELWERGGRYFGKYAEDGPDVELSVAQPDTGLVRVLVDPAAAAEVEARTGAVATDTLRATVTWGPASPENMLTFTTPDVWIVTPPRAGLPSRDEVAAFLEGLKPPEPPAEPRPCQRCRKPLPPERTWFHAECMDPKVKP